MLLSRVTIVFLMLAGIPAHALQVVAPDIAENGAVIPIEVKLNTPLSAGQQLDVMVNGEPAATVKVVKGTVTGFQTRVKGSRNDTTVAARVMANGSELDSGSQNVRVNLTVPASGPPTAAGPMKIRNRGGGDVIVLIPSENGFAGTLVFAGAELQVEVLGSAILSKNPLIGVRGDFAGDVSASIGSQTLVASASPGEDNPAAARARDEAREQQRRAQQAEMERLKTEQAKAQEAKDSHLGQDLLGLLGSVAGAAAGGTNVTERKQLAVGALAANAPSGSNTELLGNVASAAAAGKNAAERKQLAVGALAANSPNGSNNETGNRNGNGADTSTASGAGAYASYIPGPGNCARRGLKVIDGLHTRLVSWPGQDCAQLVHERSRSNRPGVRVHNTCQCNVRVFVHSSRNNYISDHNLKVQKSTGFMGASETTYKVLGACNLEGISASYFGFDEKTGTCRIATCFLDGTCGKEQSTAK